MSFTRVNSGGWSVGATLTSAQMNQLDTNVSNALDKSAAGDQISGVITFNSGGQLNANRAASIVVSASNAMQITSGGGIEVNAGAGIQAAVSNAIESAASSGILSVVAGGIATSVAGGISDGHVVGGIAATIAGGIAPTVAGGIGDGAIAGGIATTTAGGLVLGGGSGDWPTFSATRTRNNTFRFPNPRYMPSGWQWQTNGLNLIGPATSTSITFPLEMLHHGATLAGLYIIFNVFGSHSGGVPANLPQLGVFGIHTQAGYSIGSQIQLYAGSSTAGAGYQQFGTSPASPSSPPATGSAWYDSGSNQAFGFIPNQNNVIDTYNYQYYAVLVDEYGANSASGNVWYSIAPLYSNIANMQFA